jgi:hypothetical protein
MGRNYYAVQLASAEILAGQAAEMIADAAGILKDAGDREGERELNALSNKVGIAVERLQVKRRDAEAGEDTQQC